MYRLAVAVALVVASFAGVTGVATPASAQTSEGVLDDVFSSGDASETAEATLRALWAAQDRVLFDLQGLLPSAITDRFPGLAPDRQTASDELASVASYYNSHNATLESWLNSRADVIENRTVKLVLYLRGETATRYLEVNASGGNVTRSAIVTSTDRELTDTVELCGYAADQALEELERFNNEYAEPGEDVDREYLAGLAGKYGGDVETTLMSSTSSDCGGGA